MSNAKNRKTIPDLRNDHQQITLDHCYVLLSALGDSIELMDGTTGISKQFIDNIDAEIIQDTLHRYFKAPEFSRLFNSPLGKGVLVGIYLKQLFDDSAGENIS